MISDSAHTEAAKPHKRNMLVRIILTELLKHQIGGAKQREG